MVKKTEELEQQEKAQAAQVKFMETKLCQEWEEQSAKQSNYWAKWSQEYMRQAKTASEEQNNTIKELRDMFSTKISKLTEQHQQEVTHVRHELSTLKVFKLTPSALSMIDWLSQVQKDNEIAALLRRQATDEDQVRVS